MYEKFLEYWGNFLFAASKNNQSSKDIVSWISENKDQLRYMANWVRQTHSGFGEFKDLFYQTWGLDKNNDYTPDFFKKWKEAEQEFQHNISDFFAVFGAVPMNEHQDVLRENKKLKYQVEELEKKVANLRQRLEDAQIEDCKKMTEEVNQVITNQNKEFQNMLQSMMTDFFSNKTS